MNIPPMRGEARSWLQHDDSAGVSSA